MTSTTLPLPVAPVHRIGAVSHLSGVPVSTLRIWEVRYGTFEPAKSVGKQRLYSDDDVLKAVLLRQLTQQGYAISSLAQLNTSALNQRNRFGGWH
jgi:DNA-binding transcriptional MerR regulator